MIKRLLYAILFLAVIPFVSALTISITSPFNGQLFLPNSTVTIIANITGNTSFANATVGITGPTGAFLFNLSFNGTLYVANFNSTSLNGTYNLSVNATDNASTNMSNRSFLVEQPMFMISKTGPSTATTGQNITYKIDAVAWTPSIITPFNLSNITQITNASTNMTSPDITTTANGTIIIAFQQQTPTGWVLDVMRSTDNGQTFSSPVTLVNVTGKGATNPNLDIANNGSVLLTYQFGPGAGSGVVLGEIFVQQSFDEGLTFGPAIQVTANTSNTSDEPHIKQHPNGTFYDIYTTGTQIFISTSENLTNWSAPIQLTNNTFTNVDPSLNINKNSTFYVVWAPTAGGGGRQVIFYSNFTTLIPLILNISFKNLSTSLTDFEPIITEDLNKTLYIFYTQLLTSQGGMKDVGRTSNEIQLLTSFDNFTTYVQTNMTNNLISDTYVGVDQDDVPLNYIVYARSDGTNMQIVFAQRTPRAPDTVNVTIIDTIPAGISVINSSITGSGIFNGTHIVWTFPAIYTEQNVTRSFNATITAGECFTILNPVLITGNDTAGNTITANTSAVTVTAGACPSGLGGGGGGGYQAASFCGNCTDSQWQCCGINPYQEQKYCAAPQNHPGLCKKMQKQQPAQVSNPASTTAQQETRSTNSLQQFSTVPKAAPPVYQYKPIANVDRMLERKEEETGSNTWVFVMALLAIAGILFFFARKYIKF